MPTPVSSPRPGRADLTSWFAGGHDAGGTNPDADAQVQRFLDFHLAGRGSDPGTGLSYQLTGSVGSDGTEATQTVTAATYPGLHGNPTPTRQVVLTGGTPPRPHQRMAPPGRTP